MTCRQSDSDRLAVYVHIPFCARRCPYCDFATVAGHDDWIPSYFEALASEIAGSPHAGRPVSSVYFGGGTPTYVEPSHICDALQRIRHVFRVEPDAEITAEANPASSDSARFAQLRGAGFNRLSIGVQSFRDDVLRSLGRLHTGHEALRAIQDARHTCFDSISVDLMYGCPGQRRSHFLDDLTVALDSGADHISIYALTVEPSTPLADRVDCGEVVLPDEDAVADMYAAAIDMLERAGWEHYEVSNFARPGRLSRHNMAYWTDVEYVGFGAGAASYTCGVRRVNVRTPMEYVARFQAHLDPTMESEALTTTQRLTEMLMLGLRLRDGIEEREFVRRFGHAEITRLQPALDRQLNAGTLERCCGRLRLTRRGLLIADAVLADLIPA